MNASRIFRLVSDLPSKGCSALAVALLAFTACTPSGESGSSNASAAAGASVTIRVTGSDTMVNLAQAWQENYNKKNANVSIQIAGGGSSVGITGLINGTVDLATASREMSPVERAKAKAKNKVEPKEFTTGLDAVAVYVHKDNPLEEISVDDLARIYSESGDITKWSQLGVQNEGCREDNIIRVSRQNNSGTYVYFRNAVLGKSGKYKAESIDQSGSKDVVSLVATTPCSIGYSGMGYATAEVKMLKIAKKKGDPPVAPTVENAASGSYPVARPLFLYSREEPTGALKAFIDWILSPEGQKIVSEVGYVPIGT